MWLVDRAQLNAAAKCPPTVATMVLHISPCSTIHEGKHSINYPVNATVLRKNAKIALPQILLFFSFISEYMVRNCAVELDALFEEAKRNCLCSNSPEMQMEPRQ